MRLAEFRSCLPYSRARLHVILAPSAELEHGSVPVVCGVLVRVDSPTTRKESTWIRGNMDMAVAKALRGCFVLGSQCAVSQYSPVVDVLEEHIETSRE